VIQWISSVVGVIYSSHNLFVLLLLLLKIDTNRFKFKVTEVTFSMSDTSTRPCKNFILTLKKNS